jgi:ribosomal protein S18 acetylase RimI-like enzyme
MTDPSARQVRAARPTELDQVGEVLLASFREHAASIPDDILRPYLADLLRVGPHATPLVVSESGGRIVATARLYVDGAASGLPLPDGWSLVRAVGVLPSHRRSGYATALMAECAQRSARAGAPALALHTARFMAAAVRLYEGLGYRRAAELDFVAGPPAAADPGHQVQIRGYVLPLANDQARDTA